MMKILDGGIGIYLRESGAPFEQPEWSALALIEEPDSVRRAHLAFAEAGAGVITTNSYALVPFHIGETRFLEEGPRLLKLAGKLAAEVRNESKNNLLVAASIPPVFGSYEPDKFKPDEAIPLLNMFKENLVKFTDLVLAETVSSITEAKVIQDVFSDINQPLWISFSLEDKHMTEPKLRSGELVTDAIRSLDLSNCQALLFNCNQPEIMEQALITAAPLLTNNAELGVYANGFKPDYNDKKANSGHSELREDLTPDQYLKFARYWKSLGATIIGGCCGIGVAHIARLRELL